MNNALARCIGEKVRHFRHSELAISQEELAERCGLHVSHVSRMESGTLIPRIETLLKICKGLNVTLSHLIPSFNEPCEKKYRNVRRDLLDNQILLALTKLSSTRKRALLRFLQSYHQNENQKLKRAS